MPELPAYIDVLECPVSIPAPLAWAYSFGTMGDEGAKKDFELAVLAVFDRALTDFEINAMSEDYPID